MATLLWNLGFTVGSVNIAEGAYHFNTSLVRLYSWSCRETAACRNLLTALNNWYSSPASNIRDVKLGPRLMDITPVYPLQERICPKSRQMMSTEPMDSFSYRQGTAIVYSRSGSSCKHWSCGKDALSAKRLVYADTRRYTCLWWKPKKNTIMKATNRVGNGRTHLLNTVSWRCFKRLPARYKNAQVSTRYRTNTITLIESYPDF